MADPAKLILLVGLPGARKTRLADELVETDHPGAYVVSSDAVRWNFGPKYRADCERFVWEIIDGYIQGCLNGGRSIIVDATNLSRFRRAYLKAHADQLWLETECYYIPLPTDESARRSAKWIPKTSINQLAEKLEEPCEDEGFSRIVIVEQSNEYYRAKTAVKHGKKQKTTKHAPKRKAKKKKKR